LDSRRREHADEKLSFNESQDAVVFTTCAWAKNGNFLDREFTMNP
jgi:hypothetical protein